MFFVTIMTFDFRTSIACTVETFKAKNVFVVNVFTMYRPPYQVITVDVVQQVIIKLIFTTKSFGFTLKSFSLRPVPYERINIAFCESIRLERSAAVINDNVIGMYRETSSTTTRDTQYCTYDVHPILPINYY